MQARRSDTNYETTNSSDAVLAGETIRPKGDVGKQPKSDDERMSIFWRVFGGTLVSIAALVGITLFNALNNTLSELRNDIAKLNESRADAVKKDEFNARTTNTWDRVQGLQTQLGALVAAQTNLQTEMTGLKEKLGKQAVDMEAMRKEATLVNDSFRKDLSGLELVKERVTAVESLKKELAALDVAKEKLSNIAAELKSQQDDLKKIRADVDRNLAADEERKTRRDSLQAQVEITLKELTKGVQDCREKLARLEGSQAPAVKPTEEKKSAGPRKSDDGGSDPGR